MIKDQRLTLNSFLFIIAVSVISSLPMFIITEPLWDDFTLYKQSYEGIKEHFVDNGFHTVGLSQFHFAISKLPNPFLWVKIISTVLTTAIAILFAQILLKMKVTDEKSTITIIFVFLTLPLFTYRFSQITLPHLFALTSFIGGISLLVSYFQNQKNNYFLISISLIFLSFIISSLLVFFYAVILLLFIFYRDIFFKSRIKAGALLLMPIVAFILSRYLLKPSGIHAIMGYNEITLKGLILTGPLNSLADIYRIPYAFVLSMKDIFSKSGNIIIFIALFISFSLLVAYAIRKKLNFQLGLPSPFIIIGVGVFLLLAAVYPYEVVNNSTTSFFYNSRNQILVPFGVSLALFGVLNLIFEKSRNLFIIIFSLLISINFIVSFHIYAQYYNNTLLQKSFLVNWKKNEHRIPENVILVDVQNIKFQALQRWNFYEIGGLLRINGMKTDKLITDISLSKDLKKVGTRNLAKKMYNTEDFNASATSERTIKVHFKKNMLSIPECVQSILNDDLANEKTLEGLIDIEF